MENTVSILTIGSELLDGRVLDTNSHFLASLFEERGITLAHVLSCTDDEDTIKRCLDFLLDESRVVILSGGLGPTTDDLTREAVAGFSSRRLIQDPEVVKTLEELYQLKRRVLDASNIKQTYFPEGARIIPNPTGTAAGFWLTLERRGQARDIFSLPGVPGELKKMIISSVLPEAEKILDKRIVQKKRAFRTFGLPEAAVGERITATQLAAQTVVSYRAHFPEIHVVLKNPDEVALVKDFEAAQSAVGHESIFSTDLETSFEAIVQQQLLSQKRTIAVAESCTGGMLGALLTNTPGSSACFLGGVVSYSNAAKVSQLGVSEATLSSFGAVSHKTAKEMALGVQKAFRADIGVSITGIAGPDGGTPEKPVGLFYIGLASGSDCHTEELFFNSSRYRIRSFAAYSALNAVRKLLTATS